MDLWALVAEKCDACTGEALREVSRVCRDAVNAARLEPTVSLRVENFLGSIAMLNWAVERGCPLSAKTFARAARCASLDVLRELKKLKCPWNSRVCVYAALRGRVDVFEWARENGCVWNSLVCAAAPERVKLRQKLETLEVCPCNGLYHLLHIKRVSCEVIV